MNAFEPSTETVTFTDRALVNPEIKSGLFFLFPFPIPCSILAARGPQKRRTAGTLYFQPPSRSFHLFRSRHRMARGDELSLLPPLFPTLARTARQLTRVLWLAPHGRFDRWTNRPVVISTYPQVRLIRPGDVFIHRASLPL